MDKKVIEEKIQAQPYDLVEKIQKDSGTAYIFHFERELTEREYLTLALYYGLFGLHTHTYRQIGKFMGLSRSRIGQICKEALVKLGLKE